MERMNTRSTGAINKLTEARKLTDYMVYYYSLQVIGMWKLRRNRAGTD
ncbi:hypothetical protein IR083_07230 [Dysgonomonas sp. GY75]|nr:hypothetical protein [Dysgonomonas sp. GY75]MBF0648607.1 hypothetical protein [Dysgonomonas sp. GY75]